MAKQFTNREKLALQLDHFSESEIDEIVEYVSSLETMQREPSPPDFDDDLIAALSAAYENRRAQQVFAWDAVRQRARAAHR